jgi:glycosyltransferase involved in cell wall biosynthesis
VGFIGSFYGYEGLGLIIEALAQILPAAPQVRVLLVGGGTQEVALKQAVAARSLSDFVVFAGRVPHERVPDYYQLIDVLAYPRLPMRLTQIVTPLKPLEAMAAGRLVVASDVGGHRELIRDGENGVLFRANDAASLAAAVLAVLRSPGRAEAMCTAGRRFVEAERSWPAVVARYRPVYEGLLGR